MLNFIRITESDIADVVYKKPAHQTDDYGSKIDSGFKIKLKDSKRWYKVYYACFSNCGTAYIKRRKTSKGQFFSMEDVIDISLRDLMEERKWDA